VAVEFTFLFAAGNYRTIAIKVYPRAKPMLTANITQSHCNRCSTWRMNTVYNMNYECLDPFVLPANLNQQSRGARLLQLFTFLTQKLSFSVAHLSKVHCVSRLPRVPYYLVEKKMQTIQKNLLSIVQAAAVGPTSIKNSFNVAPTKYFFWGKTLPESFLFFNKGKRQ